MNDYNLENHNNYNIGQCYVSTSEPTLGVGIILKVADRVITVFFPNSDENRNYATGSAPLKRLIHEVGSKVITVSKECCEIAKIIFLKNGNIEYKSTDGDVIAESQIISALDYNSPLKRLKQQDFDDNNVFDLRKETLHMQKKLMSSHARGLCGARVELLPHQLYIAAQNSSEKLPRIMLADEVGLGKTIEAGLILHRLLAIGLAERALIIVPDALVHQWFVEMLRKFNLQCSLITEDWIKVGSELSNEGQLDNIFSENQLIIASLEVVTNNAEIQQQLLNEKFDILIVDEAHKLEWNVEHGASPEYDLVDKISEITTGVILLTATPEHFGYEGHFARLRLLNKERFYDLNAFIAECKSYQLTANIAEKLQNDSNLSAEDKKYLFESGIDFSKSKIALQRLLDRHGLTHIMYRNSRKNMANFPKRQAVLTAIESLNNEDFQRLNDVTIQNYVSQATVNYLAKLLTENLNTKFLAICSTKEKVVDIFNRLQKIISVNIAVFHENMTIIDRDRNGAYFADESIDGAQLLICSEIGSEGRNFQFAHNLIMLDLVFDIALIEQRIGRLDRIGQTETIKIHLPYIKNSIEECLVHWYNNGIGVFKQCLNLNFGKFEAIKHELQDYFANDFEYNNQKITEIIKRTIQLKEQVILELEQGRDHLLELGSFNESKANSVIDEVTQFNEEIQLPKFTEKILEFFGVKIDKLSLNDWQLSTQSMFSDALVDLPPNSDEIKSITFSRKTACKREDILFLNSDSALIHSGIDALLSSTQGNCALKFLKKAYTKGIFLEVVFSCFVIAPKNLHIERFLPTTPINIVLDTNLKEIDIENFNDAEEVIITKKMSLPQQLFDNFIPNMLDCARDKASQKAKNIIAEAQEKTQIFFVNEIEKIEYLAKNNVNISESDLSIIKERKDAVNSLISQAQINVDALRLIISK
ncbi:RNA polymerase-associated protein RapA [Lentisphaerota bacterium WC36G]|nr:RNA polymerase-associated protein RapA [Lentisphaerae bacterium WC36]